MPLAGASPDIWTPPALPGRVRFSDARSDCKEYIRPLDASVDAGPDDNRSQEPHYFLGVWATVRAIRFILRRSDLFPSATTLWQFLGGSYLPRSRSCVTGCPAYVRP